MTDLDPDDVDGENTAELLVETIGAVRGLVEELRMVRDGFDRERVRRRWATRLLAGAVVVLIVVTSLVAWDNSRYRVHRCESANDTRQAIRSSVSAVFATLAAHPTPAQQQRIDAVNSALAAQLPDQSC